MGTIIPSEQVLLSMDVHHFEESNNNQEDVHLFVLKIIDGLGVDELVHFLGCHTSGDVPFLQ